MSQPQVQDPFVWLRPWQYQTPHWDCELPPLWRSCLALSCVASSLPRVLSQDSLRP
jgi:hypothetical protein